MTGDIQIPVRPERQARRLLKLGSGGEYAPWRPCLPVESQHAIGLMTIDVQIAIRPERQPGAILIDLVAWIARIAGGEHVHESPCCAVIPPDGGRLLTVDIQIAFWPESHCR